MMTLNTSVLIVLALTLIRRCAEGCVETFPNLTDSSTECKNTTTTCSVTCKPGKIFYDGDDTKTYSCNEDKVWSPSLPQAGCKDKTQALYLIRLTAQYKSWPELATYCLEAHRKALNDTIGNLASPLLSYCMNNAGVGNISIISDIPVVGVKLTSYLTQIHEDVVLYCEVQFSSSVEYLYWQQDYRNLTVNNNARYSGGTIDISSLTIHEATYDDTGYYTCNAVSQSGTGTSLFINLTDVGDGADDQTAVQHTPTSTGGLTGGITETKNDQTLFIAIGAGCGGLIIAIIVLVILIKSCRSTSSASQRGSIKSNLEQDHQDSYDSDYDGLKDNRMYIPFDQYELIDQNYVTVDSQRSLSAENRFATDANDRTSSMNAYGKSHENSSQNKYVYQNVAFNNEDDIQKSDDRVENVCPPAGSNDVYVQVDNIRE